MSIKNKGQATLVGHAILIAISIALVLVVVVAFNSIRTQYQEFIGTSDLEQVCSLIRSSAEKIYTNGNYHSPGDTVYGKISIKLPQRIADLNYRAQFFNNSLHIETLAAPKMNLTCMIGLNTTLRGTTRGGITELQYQEISGKRELVLTQTG